MSDRKQSEVRANVQPKSKLAQGDYLSKIDEQIFNLLWEKLDLGWTYQASDYATSKEQEKRYERTGRREAKKVAQSLTALFEAIIDEQYKQYDEIFKWLLGESGWFPVTVKGARYNWRPELRKRLAQLKAKKGML